MPTKIDEIEEMNDLFEIMKWFGLSTKGLKGVDDMKAKLREYLEDLERSSKRKVRDGSINSPMRCLSEFVWGVNH